MFDESYIKAMPPKICTRCEGKGWLWWFEFTLDDEDDCESDDCDSFTCPECGGTGTIE